MTKDTWIDRFDERYSDIDKASFITKDGAKATDNIKNFIQQEIDRVVKEERELQKKYYESKNKEM